MNAREAAYRILFSFETRRDRLDDLLAGSYRAGNLPPSERRLLRNLSSGVIRNRTLLDWHINKLYAGNPKKLRDTVRVLLRMAFYEILFLPQIPPRASVNEYVNLAGKHVDQRSGKLVNGLLRAYLRRQEKPVIPQGALPVVEKLSITYSFPEWMIRRWLAFWPEEEVAALCEAFNRPPEFDLRINRTRTSVEEVMSLLEKKNISCRKSERFDSGITISDLQSLVHSGILENGLCSVQDESAAIPVELLELSPGDRILDMCAAPGGKYTQILENLNGEGLAVAADSDLKRMKRVRENVRRLGLIGGRYVVADGRHLPFKPGFDRVLLDAPCSGLGVIRKHPDIKWRRSMQEINAFSRLQTALIHSAAEIVKDSGRLVYSTCTVDILENDTVVNGFMESAAPVFTLVPVPERFAGLADHVFIRTFPHRHDTDGSFCAIVVKNAKKSNNCLANQPLG